MCSGSLRDTAGGPSVPVPEDLLAGNLDTPQNQECSSRGGAPGGGSLNTLSGNRGLGPFPGLKSHKMAVPVSWRFVQILVIIGFVAFGSRFTQPSPHGPTYLQHLEARVRYLETTAAFGAAVAPPSPSALSAVAAPSTTAAPATQCAADIAGSAVSEAVRTRASPDNIGGEPFTTSSILGVHPCVQPGGEGATWSPLRDVLFVVLASSKTLDRVRAMRETWARLLTVGVNLLIIGDADIPDAEIAMTTLPELAGRGERGHAGHRTLRALIFASQDARYSHFAWFFAIDDDTFVNLAALPSLLAGWDVRVPMLLSFIWHSPHFGPGRTWPSGGAGMLMTRSAVRLFADNLYTDRCAFLGENDLTLGACAWRVGVALVQSPLFDPEADSLAASSTWARDKNDATVRTLVTIHRAGPERMRELFAAVLRHASDNKLAGIVY